MPSAFTTCYWSASTNNETQAPARDTLTVLALEGNAVNAPPLPGEASREFFNPCPLLPKSVQATAYLYASLALSPPLAPSLPGVVAFATIRIAVISHHRRPRHRFRLRHCLIGLEVHDTQPHVHLNVLALVVVHVLHVELFRGAVSHRVLKLRVRRSNLRHERLELSQDCARGGRERVNDSWGW